MAALALLALLPLFWLSPAPARAQDAGGPRVAAFSPQGTVKAVRQVTARFSEPMVPLGDPREARDPFEVSCPEPGTARAWASCAPPGHALLDRREDGDEPGHARQLVRGLIEPLHRWGAGRELRRRADA